MERSRLIRKALTMRVHPDRHAEYESRHNPIRPELARVLKDHGVHNYSIFLDPQTSTLFAYAEIECESRWAAIADTDVCQRWWAHMSPIMASNPDQSPATSPLNEVFHL